jgi:hypothetical protein
MGLAAGTGFGVKMYLDSVKKTDELRVAQNYDSMSAADKEYFDKNVGSQPMKMLAAACTMGILCFCFTCAVICGKDSL